MQASKGLTNRSRPQLKSTIALVLSTFTFGAGSNGSVLSNTADAQSALSPERRLAEAAQTGASGLVELQKQYAVQLTQILLQGIEAVKKSNLEARTEVKNQFATALSTSQALYVTHKENSAKAGDKKEINGHEASAWILVQAADSFSSQYNTLHDSFVIVLRDGIRRIGGDASKFESTCFYDTSPRRPKPLLPEKLAYTFVASTKKVAGNNRETLLIEEMQKLVQSAFECLTTNQTAPYLQAQLTQSPVAFNRDNIKEHTFDSEEKIASGMKTIRDDLAALREPNPAQILTIQTNVDSFIAKVQYNSALDASSQIFSRYEGELISGKRTMFDENRCLAEMYITAGAISVRKCGGSELNFQLLLPYFMGFDDEQVKACYQLAYGTVTPDEHTSLVSERTIAEAIINITEKISKGKGIASSVLSYSGTEILKGVLSDASAEIKGALCFAEIRDAMRAVGFVQLNNFYKLRNVSHSEFRTKLDDVLLRNRAAYLNFQEETTKCIAGTALDAITKPLVKAIVSFIDYLSNQSAANVVLTDARTHSIGTTQDLLSELRAHWPGIDGASASFPDYLGNLQSNLDQATSRANKCWPVPNSSPGVSLPGGVIQIPISGGSGEPKSEIRSP